MQAAAQPRKVFSALSVSVMSRLFRRALATSARRTNANTHAHTHAHAHARADAVVAEKQHVAAMDALLSAVRQKSDPTYHNVVPMRSPVLWSETLLSRSVAPDTPSPSPSSSGPSSSSPSPTPTAPPPALDLAPRRMADSYTELVLPFASDPHLLEAYTNASGGIRTGKLMEHLDSLAGSIAYKHMLGPAVTALGPIHQHGFYIVTASVDRLDTLHPLSPARDLRLSGHVIYTGRSSMEVAVKMESVGPPSRSPSSPSSLSSPASPSTPSPGINDTPTHPDTTVLLGRFSMVCRDAATHKSRPVRPLLISSPEEESLHALGEDLKHTRTLRSQRSLSRVPPSSAEAAALHEFYLAHGEGSPGPPAQETGNDNDNIENVWMGDTVLEKCMLMFPQERNVHQKIFGGYLMRLAYELGYTNASLFTRGPVAFLALDGIAFARPVPIGSILRLRAQVVCTSIAGDTFASEDKEEKGNGERAMPVIVHVRVQANVVDVHTGLEQTTNDFHFTWGQPAALPSISQPGAAGQGQVNRRPRRVVPRTYKEAMLWLEGKRALALGAEIRAARTTARA